MKNQKTNYILLILSLVLLACVSKDSNKANQEKEIQTQENLIESNQNDPELNANQVKRIFFTLPSPLELSLLFKKEGIVYYPEQLHKKELAENYVLSKKKALNLGVYGADLSYAGLFSKHEDAIAYFTISQSLAEEVGISNSFEKDFIARLERNANDRDTLLQVISDFFLNNDSYLKDQDLQITSAYILTGGWIEGMYLGSRMVDSKTNAAGVRDIIASQKYSLENLIMLLDNLEDKGSFNEINAQLKDLLLSFETIEYPEFKEPKDSIDPDGIMVIDNTKGEIEISNASFEEIKNKLDSIRNSIIG